MCGIAGTFGRQLDFDQVSNTLSALQHRGPDANGHCVVHAGNYNVTLLHTRLAVIDLQPNANQPMKREHLSIVFNGEIYNYIEVRSELMRLGHEFKTQSDTEVLLAAYMEWDVSCFDRLEGMWSFALWNESKRELILSRDRFGEKPLYYLHSNGSLFFSSDPKGLETLSGEKLKPNFDHLRRYLVNGFRSIFKGESTFYDGVKEVQPATYICFKSPIDWVEHKYWELAHKPVAMTLCDALEGAQEKLYRAIRLRLRSDVPIAFCLSGGVDSTTLAAIARKKYGQEIHAFSIVDSDERYNELDNIRSVVDALGCDHHVTYTSTDGFFERMKSITRSYGGPVPTISYYVHSFLSEEIRRQGYTVAISGTGADEIFTGYYDHYSFWLAYMHNRPDFDNLVSDWQGSYGKWVNNPYLRDPLSFIRNPNDRSHIYQNRDLFNSYMVQPSKDEFEEEEYSTELLRKRMMNELFHEVVPVILRADDSNSMNWSVENRSPYLDRELVEFLYTVPSEHLIHEGYPKYLLRMAAKDMVPDDVRLDTRKRGFNASIDSLFDRTSDDVRQQLLDDSPIFDIVKRDEIENFLNNDLTDNSFSKFMFSYISAKTFVDGLQHS